MSLSLARYSLLGRPPHLLEHHMHRYLHLLCLNVVNILYFWYALTDWTISTYFCAFSHLDVHFMCSVELNDNYANHCYCGCCKFNKVTSEMLNGKKRITFLNLHTFTLFTFSQFIAREASHKTIGCGRVICWEDINQEKFENLKSKTRTGARKSIFEKTFKFEKWFFFITNHSFNKNTKFSDATTKKLQ